MEQRKELRIAMVSLLIPTYSEDLIRDSLPTNKKLPYTAIFFARIHFRAALICGLKQDIDKGVP